MGKKKQKTKIMVFGTFDGLHKGHLNFFKQAKKLSKDSFLVVSVARDKNVFRIKKSLPYLNEKKRWSLIKKSSIVDQVVMGGVKNHITHIKKVHPNFIALGYDQRAYVKNLKKDLKNIGVLVKIVRLKPYKEKIYKNHLLNKKS
jgi:cytidyltransferase-like protein